MKYFVLAIIFLLYYVRISFAENLVTLKASYSIRKDFNETKSFKSLLRRPDAVLRLLSVNPGLDRVDKLSKTIYRGQLAPIHNPGLSIYQTIDFNVFSNTTTLIISVPNGAVKQTYTGSQFLVNLYSKLSPSNVRSNAILAVDRYGKYILSDDATLEVDMRLPSWFPFPPSMVEKGGSQSIQKKIETDINAFIKNVIGLTNNYKQEQQLKRSSLFFFFPSSSIRDGNNFNKWITKSKNQSKEIGYKLKQFIFSSKKD